MYGLMGGRGSIWLPSLLMPRSVLGFGIRTYTRLVRWGLEALCGVRTEVRGLGNLPDGPIIYAAKHQCMWDIFIPFLVLKDPVITMKRELLWYPFFGWFAMKMEMIAIDRGGAAKTIRAMLVAAKTRMDEGRQFVIFPEGTRAPPGAKTTYYAAGTGAFYKALAIPVVPVATNSGLCWPPRGIVRTPGTIVFEILPTIPPGLDRKTLMADLEAAIEPASARLLAEGRAFQAGAKEDPAPA